MSDLVQLHPRRADASSKSAEDRETRKRWAKKYCADYLARVRAGEDLPTLYIKDVMAALQDTFGAGLKHGVVSEAWYEGYGKAMKQDATASDPEDDDHVDVTDVQARVKELMSTLRESIPNLTRIEGRVVDDEFIVSWDVRDTVSLP